MNKVAIFAFKGDPMCFVHVLLNAKDMYEKGIDVKVVIECEAVTLLQNLEQNKTVHYPMSHHLYYQIQFARRILVVD